MLGTKLLLILVPMLLAEAQNNLPRRPGLARRSPFFRPGGRPGLFTVVTSVPVASTTTEKIQIITEPNPTVTPPKDNMIISISPDVTTLPISNPPNIKPTELTIVYPENYKLVSTFSPPIPSRGPVRLPLNRPRPSMGPDYKVPITPSPPPPPTSPKPIEIVTFNIIASAPPANEIVMIPSTEKQLEIQPVSTKPVYIEAPIFKEPISEEPVSEEPMSEEPISKKPISEEPISVEPITKEPVYEKPISKEPVSLEPITKEPVFEEPISKDPVSVEPITKEPVSEEPISEVPKYVKPISASDESKNPTSAVIEPTINQPFNWHIIPPATIQVPMATQRPLTTRSLVNIFPSAPATQKPVGSVQPSIITQRLPSISEPYQPSVSELPIEIKPSKDIFHPSTSSESNPAVGGNKPTRQPAMIWHPVQQKPRTTLVPTTTEVYTPTITKKPKKPVSAAKLWSPVDNTYTVNRLHDYICKSMDGYESILNKCDAYIECKRNLAFQNTCPDGLHFNPAVKWPEYPCGYPSEVQCRSQDAMQEPQPSDQCPHRYGFYSMPGSDCGQYIMCQEGLPTVMSCPPGLAFSSITNSCDWAANVPGCSPLIFREYSCPPPTVDKYGKQTYDDSKFRFRKSCKQYIDCHKGNPRLLSCDAGMSFDEEYETCVDADQVMDCQQ